MKKYRHKEIDSTAISFDNTNYYHVSILNEMVHKSLIENSNDWELISIEEKKPILTTHDGVELFDLNVFVHYIKRSDFNYYTTKLIYFKDHYNDCEVFSNKEKALEYIDWNKPKYSLNDVKKAGGLRYVLIELEKLNK